MKVICAWCQQEMNALPEDGAVQDSDRSYCCLGCTFLVNGAPIADDAACTVTAEGAVANTNLSTGLVSDRTTVSPEASNGLIMGKGRAIDFNRTVRIVVQAATPAGDIAAD